MDDKEKEKFGVVIDKDKEQSSGEQPESEKNPSENQNLTSDDQKKENIEQDQSPVEESPSENQNLTSDNEKKEII